MLRYLIVAITILSANLYAQQTIETRIDAILDIYNKPNQPGLGIRVVKDDSIIYSKAFGVSNLDYGIKNTDSTVFSLASISKQFTASVIWSLLQANKISLEDDIRKYLPEFPNYGETVKIKHLLNHSGGIRGYHTLMHLSGFDYDTVYYDNETVLQLACRQKNLNNRPGEKVVYSNTHYNLLTIIIERITKKNLNDYLKEHILKPLKMNQTFVRVEHGKPIQHKAIGYKYKDDGYIYSTSNQLSYGAGSMGSSVIDMTIWMQMLNGNNPAFKSLSQFLKTTEVLLNGEEANYARGVMVDTYKGYKTVSHSGYGFGGQSQLITIPEEGIGVIIMTNLQSINPTPISYKILDVLLPEKLEEKKDIKVDYNIGVTVLKKFIGEYKEVNSDMKMTISMENDTLKALSSLGRNAIPLIPFAKDKFCRLQSQSVKYDFSKRSNYDLVISFGGTPFYFEKAKFVNPASVNLNEYTGDFYSEELETNYRFYIEDNTLKLSYTNNMGIALSPVQLNEFGNNDRTLYQFIKDKNNSVISMYLSCDGQVSNIEFVKQKSRL